MTYDKCHLVSLLDMLFNNVQQATIGAHNGKGCGILLIGNSSFGNLESYKELNLKLEEFNEIRQGM